MVRAKTVDFKDAWLIQPNHNLTKSNVKKAIIAAPDHIKPELQKQWDDYYAKVMQHKAETIEDLGLSESEIRRLDSLNASDLIRQLKEVEDLFYKDVKKPAALKKEVEKGVGCLSPVLVLMGIVFFLVVPQGAFFESLPLFGILAGISLVIGGYTAIQFGAASEASNTLRELNAKRDELGKRCPTSAASTT